MQWKTNAKAYFDEAKWFHEGCIPSMEECVRVATASAGHTTLTTMSLLGMGDIVTKESFEWLLNDPKILRASNIIGRLMDDIVSSEVQKVAIVVHYYMILTLVSQQLLNFIVLTYSVMCLLRSFRKIL